MDVRIHKANDPAVLNGLAVAGDIDLTTGDLQFVEGIDAVRQHLTIRLSFFLGEWPLDRRLGVPWYQNILGKTGTETVVRAVFEKVILGTPGIVSITELNFEYIGANRTLRLNLTAQTDLGGPLVYDEPLLIGILGAQVDE